MSDEIYINTKNAPHSQLGQLGQELPTTLSRSLSAVQGDLQVQYFVDGQTPFTYHQDIHLLITQDQGRYPFQTTGRQPNNASKLIWVDIRLPFLR